MNDMNASKPPGGRWKVPLVVATSVVMFALSIINIQEKNQFERHHDGVFWESVEGRVLAEHISAGGPGERAGVEPGDILVSLGERPVNHPSDVREVLDGLRSGDALSYQILRAAEQRALVLSVEPLPKGSVGAYYFLATVGGFFLLVGTVVYVRRRGVHATAHFYLLCLFWFLAYGFSFTGKLDGWDLGFYWIDRAGLLFFPPIFLHFALCFPVKRPIIERKPWLLMLLYMPSVFLLQISLASKVLFFSDVSWSEWLTTETDALVNRLTPAFVAVMCLAAFAAFVRSYRTARSITVKKQTKWIVWGTGVGTLPFAVFYAVPYLLGFDPSFEMKLSVVPLAMIPLSFTYAITKYRLMDVEVLFKRGVTYTLATSAVAALFLAIFLIGTHYLVTDSHGTAIALLSAMCAVLAFTPVKDLIQNGVDRLFYRDRYDYRRALRAFSRDLNADLNLDNLSARLAERIRDTFEVEKVALMLPLSSSDGLVSDLSVHAGEGLGQAEWDTLSISADSELFHRLSHGEVVTYGEFDWTGLKRESRPEDGYRLGLDESDEPSDSAHSGGLQYAIPCCAHGKVIAVMLLGRRWDQSALSSEDMELLTMLSGQAATALENARLYRSLEQKAAQFEELKEQSENTIESLEAGILVLDLEGRVTRWNRALESLYGVEREEALGQEFDALFPKAVQRTLVSSRGDAWWNEAGTTNISRMNLTNRRGEDKTIKLQVAPFVSEGETQGTIVFFEDITARVGMESELQLREKMVSLGLMAAGVAHEVNTPLTGISSFTQMLREQANGDDDRLNLLQKIEKQTERASRIVNNLLNFARHERARFAPVNMNEVVQDVLALQEHQLKKSRIKVRLELDETLPDVLGDENKLQQVLFNLISNAQSSMSSGGWLTARTRSDSHSVVVTISDTGDGISQQDIKRIYDPFFTTKARGTGTGLGLSIAYGIVQEHSGQISVESALGKGTTFALELPPFVRAPARGVAVGSAENRG